MIFIETDDFFSNFQIETQKEHIFLQAYFTPVTALEDVGLLSHVPECWTHIC